MAKTVQMTSITTRISNYPLTNINEWLWLIATWLQNYLLKLLYIPEHKAACCSSSRDERCKDYKEKLRKK